MRKATSEMEKVLQYSFAIVLVIADLNLGENFMGFASKLFKYSLSRFSIVSNPFYCDPFEQRKDSIKN